MSKCLRIKIFCVLLIFSVFAFHPAIVQPLTSQRFIQKITAFSWVCYSPTNYNPFIGVEPSIESIKQDLQVLYEHGFKGIVTYASYGTLAEVPRIALELGFEGVIMGVWDPDDKTEINNAVKMKHYVDAYCIGNEGYERRYSAKRLAGILKDLREKTNKPVTTTEEIDDYYEDDFLIEMCDFLFPNTHPYWHNKRSAEKAYAWTQKNFRKLTKRASGKLVILKEVGMPTCGSAGCSQKRQSDYYKKLRDSNVVFIYFEAFDGPWKRWHSSEPYWGLFDKDRKPKHFIKSVGVE